MVCQYFLCQVYFSNKSLNCANKVSEAEKEVPSMLNVMWLAIILSATAIQFI